jgi:lipopolysaccharide biosynthesis glycosyltransferase
MKTHTPFVVGLCVTGPTKYWAMAIVCLTSALEHLEIKPDKILIATDQSNQFNTLKSLFDDYKISFIQVKPRSFYSQIVPSLKGNHSTYWKFDLFNSLEQDEILMYLDVDILVIRSLRISSVMDLLNSENYRLAAVTFLRPVIERSAALRLNSPFDYFNAGVLFGKNDTMYREENIIAAFNEIKKFDTLNIFWHDQDLFNFIFRNKIFKLPYIYNVHSGYLQARYRSPFLLNEVAALDIKENGTIIHFSGDFLASRKYHPYKAHYKNQIDRTLSRIKLIKNINSIIINDFTNALVNLKMNSVKINLDYFYQCFYFNDRIFWSDYYFIGLKNTIKSCRKITKKIFHSAIKLINVKK